MMKNIVVLLVLVVVGVTVHGYSTAHDDIDMKAIVADKKALQSFLYCFLDKGPCNDVTDALKARIPDVVREACATCNQTQKEKLKLFLNGSNDKLPQDYAEFKKKYDPEGTLFPALEAALA